MAFEPPLMHVPYRGHDIVDRHMGGIFPDVRRDLLRPNRVTLGINQTYDISNSGERSRLERDLHYREMNDLDPIRREPVGSFRTEEPVVPLIEPVYSKPIAFPLPLSLEEVKRDIAKSNEDWHKSMAIMNNWPKKKSIIDDD